MSWIHIKTRTPAGRLFLSFDVLMPLRDDTGRRGVKTPGPYPVLYLLHDQDMQSVDFIRKTMLEPLCERLPLAVVMPSCLNSYWVSMYRGREYGDMLLRELPAVYANNMNISSDPADTFIAGVGMGGYGALRTYADANGRFGYVAAIDAQVDADELFDKDLPVAPQDIFGPREELAQRGHDLFGRYRGLEANGVLICAKTSPRRAQNERLARACPSLVIDDALAGPDQGYFGLSRNLERLIELLPFKR